MYIVYKHTNKVNKKVYIGITKNTLKKRWQGGYGNNPHFSNAIRQYGKENFVSEIIEEGLTKSQAEEKERYYISLYDSTNPDKGYNIEKGGNHHGKHADVTKNKISKALKGKKFTKEHIEHLKKPKSVAYSEERRRAVAEFMKGNQNTKGRRHTAQEKRLISQNNKGKHGKKVYCSNGMVFNNVLEAANFFNVPRHTIMNMCNGVTKKSNKINYYFTYKEV